ncbi:MULTISPECIES: hypothetical protein [Thiorhodovibrio]|nr:MULTISPECIES: hypothetical protein [Thiorhodovibrio]
MGENESKEPGWNYFPGKSLTQNQSPNDGLQSDHSLRSRQLMLALGHKGTIMRTFEEIKIEIEALPHREYMKLMHWLSEHDWEMWDEEIEKDSAAGKLDFLINEALEEKAKGMLSQI